MYSFKFNHYDNYDFNRKCKYRKIEIDLDIYYTISYGEQRLSIYKIEEYKNGSEIDTATFKICDLDENSRPFDNYDQKFCNRIVQQLVFRHDLTTNLISMLPSTFFNSTVYECFDKWIKSSFKGSYSILLKKELPPNVIETELKNEYGEIKSALKNKRNQLLKRQKQVNLDDLYERL